MITYCLGDIEAKRKAFRSVNPKDGKMSIDNDEVLLSISEGGRTYFAVGETPFADMNVAEFVAYSKSLKSSQPVRDRETLYYAKLFGFNVGVYKRLKKLNVPEYRMAQFLAKYDLSVRDVYVNFDGFDYSFGHKRAVIRFCRKLKRYFNIYIAVSDYRFVPASAAIRNYSPDGTYGDFNPAKFTSRVGKKRAFKQLAQKRDLPLGDFRVRKIVVAK